MKKSVATGMAASLAGNAFGSQKKNNGKKVLIVWGGWDGHEPEKCVNIMAPVLQSAGFQVEISTTLDAYLGGRAEWEIPVLRQLLERPDSLERRARTLAQNLEAVAPRALQIEVVKDHSYAGGGSLPGFELPTWVVTLRAPAGAARFAECLRRATPPVLARIRDDLVVFDVRTLLDGDEKALEQALRGALR